ncbi:MAG: hypothetical protein QM779_11435 [Propionicimonas sp.]|uniref:hypothetical protein n=1 Tax=Propionicimonas sp. TaxID=1955623 RepID=UPI003D120E5D
MTQQAMYQPPTGGDPVADLSKAPLPTSKTLRSRQNLPIQLLRFISFDLRILRMVAKGHH